LASASASEFPAALQLDLPVERIGALDGLQLNQRRLAALLHRMGHRAAVDPAGQLSLLRQERFLVGRGLAIEHRDRHIAAQDLARVGAHALLDRTAERQDRRDRADAQRQAGDEQAEAAQAAAHLATREPEGQIH
jgi:hypothetical protein